MTRLLMRKPHLKKRYLTEGKKMERKKEYTLHYWDLMGGKQPHFLSFGVLWPPVGLISRMVWLCLSRPERDRAEQHCALWLPVVTQLGDGLATWLSHSTKDGEDSPTLTLGLSLSCLWRWGPCALLSAEMQSFASNTSERCYGERMPQKDPMPADCVPLQTASFQPSALRGKRGCPSRFCKFFFVFLKA